MLLLLGFMGLRSVVAADSFDDTARADMLARFERAEKLLTEAIQKDPKDVQFYSSRGDARLFLGHVADAVADYEKMIAIDPEQDAPHWRLGIAYYLAGQYEKSARQFAKYHAYDGRDRENGVWKFFAQAHAEGIEKARREMLVYERFDREPFPEVYEMLAGKQTEGEVFTEIEKKGLSHDRNVMFFANYYVGLNEALLGDKPAALGRLKQAVSDGWTGDSQPDYMWQVARLQWEALNAAK